MEKWRKFDKFLDCGVTLLNPLFFFFLLNTQENKDESDVNPFKKVENFLTENVVSGLLDIAIPIATLAFIGLGIAAMMSTDEHQRQKFKSGLWWTGLAAAICFSAKGIVTWLSQNF